MLQRSQQRHLPEVLQKAGRNSASTRFFPRPLMTEAYRMGVEAAEMWIGGTESPPPEPPFTGDDPRAEEWQRGFDQLIEKPALSNGTEF